MPTKRWRGVAVMLPSRYFADLTQPEIASQLKKNPLVILPCGSVEQHGPHLPAGTDTLAANVIAHAVAAHRPDLVHLDRIENSSDHGHGHKMDKLRRTRSYQPVLTDIRSIAPTGWFGSPQHATAEKGHRMLVDIAEAIAREARDIYR